MKRFRFIAITGSVAAVAAALPGGALAAETDYSLVTPSGTIYGTLTLPARTTPMWVVLIIAGSGPTDRNGNNPAFPAKTDTYKLLAQRLALAGIASVRYDKRGIAASAAAMPAGGEAALRFDDYIGDAVRWVKQLSADARFSRIIVAGHSEGSLVGMIAAQRAPVAAFVSLEGAGRPAAVVLREQLAKNLDDPALLAQSEQIIASLQAGKPIAVAAVSPLAPLFRASVQPYLISWFRYDPAAEIAKLTIPVTIVQGTADVQVTLDDAHALAAADKNARLVIVAGMNHMLRHAPDTSSKAAILAGYFNPALPLEPAAVDAVATVL
jgi:uncharacterized protein